MFCFDSSLQIPLHKKTHVWRLPSCLSECKAATHWWPKTPDVSSNIKIPFIYFRISWSANNSPCHLMMQWKCQRFSLNCFHWCPLGHVPGSLKMTLNFSLLSNNLLSIPSLAVQLECLLVWLRKRRKTYLSIVLKLNIWTGNTHGKWDERFGT